MPAIEPVHKAQAISYLKVTDADLAIVVNYGDASLVDERLPNFLRDRHPEFSWQPRPVAQGIPTSPEPKTWLAGEFLWHQAVHDAGSDTIGKGP